MGTRHLIGVVIDGDFKIAQYGQWDGYPSGQGDTVLDFLAKRDLDDFKEKVRSLRWLTDEDIKKVDDTPNWPQVFPHLSRDAGAEILNMVADGKVEAVQDNRDFAYESLFCEYAYIIDFDEGNLEVYTGFNKEVPTAGRWAGDDKQDGEYYAINLVATYSLSDLPTTEQMSEDVEKAENGD